MNTPKILAELHQKYPNKTIVCLPHENPSEIICEIEPASDHPERSTAMAIVGKSAAHYHKICTEVYEVVKGTLSVYIGEEKHILEVGDSITIKPGEVHSVEGDETWYLTYGNPGWTPQDHILV